MTEKKTSIKCKNCSHIVYHNEERNTWYHKHKLHSNYCECRTPEPDFSPMQKAFKEEFDKIIEKHKKDFKFDNSRGWNSISIEDKFRPFTI